MYTLRYELNKIVKLYYKQFFHPNFKQARLCQINKISRNTLKLIEDFEAYLSNRDLT